MKQSTASVPTLTETFYLSEGERQLLMAADVGEGIFFAGQNHVALRVVASKDEHTIITTDPEELIKKEEEKVAPKKKGFLFPREKSLLKTKKQAPPQPKKKKATPQEYYSHSKKDKKKASPKIYSNNSDNKEVKTKSTKTQNSSLAGGDPNKKEVAPKKSKRIRYTVDQYTPPEVFKDKN